LGCDSEVIRQRNEAFAPPPHLLLLLDIAPHQGLQRVQQQRQLDGFERLDYLQGVAAIFARMDFPYLRRIRAAASPEVVQAQVWQEVQPLLKRNPGALSSTASCGHIKECGHG
jgi:thymidylate kinase